MKAPEPRPRRLRIALYVAMFLAIWVGFGASAEAMSLALLSEREEATLPSLPWLEPEVAREADRVLARSLEGMKIPRALTLGALSALCGLVFVAAMRLLRPAGLPREGVRRLLSGAALGAAILRTIDGAQYAVVSQRVARVMASGLRPGELEGSLTPAQAAEGLASMATGAVFLYTLVISGAFLLIAQYLRSEPVRVWVQQEDQVS